MSVAHLFVYSLDVEVVVVVVVVVVTFSSHSLYPS
jgi:hypothetical protein